MAPKNEAREAPQVLYAVRVKGHAVDDKGKVLLAEQGQPKIKILAQATLPATSAQDAMDMVANDLEAHPAMSARVTEIKVTQEPAGALKWGK